MYTSKVSKNVKRLMKQQGITQKEMAEKLGIPKEALVLMLQDHQRISDQEIALFTQILEVEPNELFQD